MGNVYKRKMKYGKRAAALKALPLKKAHLNVGGGKDNIKAANRSKNSDNEKHENELHKDSGIPLTPPASIEHNAPLDVPTEDCINFDDIPPMTEEEVQEYLRKFELSPVEYFSEATNGAPLSPPPSEETKSDIVESTPVDTDYTERPTLIDFNMDEIMDYSVNSDDDALTIDDTQSKRRVPIFGFRDSQTKNNDVSLNTSKRTLLAALRTMAADIQPDTSDDYLDSVLITATGFNQRSLISGRARETMAPGVESQS